MEADRRPTYVHKISDMVLLDSKEDYYPSYNSSKQVHITYKKLVVPAAMRSIYWKCYGFPATENNEILTRNRIVCLLCKSQMIYNRNTSNLRMHLQNKHKSELETLELVQPMPSCKSGRADQRSARRGVKMKKRGDSSNIQVVPMCSQTIEQATETILPQFLTDLDEVTPLQAIVKEVTTSQSYTLEDGKLIADAVSEFIIMDLQSPEIVEGKGFQRLIATLKSPCEIPSKNRLMDEFIPRIYESVKEQLQPEISNVVNEFSLSVEDWEASSGDIYSTVSIHMATLEEGEFQTKILSNIYCSDMDALHWGAQFDAMVEEWNIKTLKVKAVIVSSDREEVYDSLTARQYLVIPCLGHTLQTACMEACFLKPNVSQLVKKCRALIALVNSTPSVYQILKEQESISECEKGGFQPDSPPLWSSTFTMFEQLLVRKDMLPHLYNGLISAGIPIHSLQFDNDDWSIIADLTDVLSPFKVAMSTLYEEKTPLISILKPLMQQLKKVHLEKNRYDTKFSAELKTNLASLIMNRYKDPKINEILDMSCTLDPRFKSLPFLTEGYKEVIKEKLRDMIEIMAQNSEGYQENRASVSKKARLSGMEFLLGDLCVRSEMPSTQRINLEIVQFECEPPISLEKSPIRYWKEHQLKFPHISKVAMQFLCIPVCVNNYLNSHFNSKTTNLNLTPQLVYKLRFLHQNNLSL